MKTPFILETISQDRFSFEELFLENKYFHHAKVNLSIRDTLKLKRSLNFEPEISVK